MMFQNPMYSSVEGRMIYADEVPANNPRREQTMKHARIEASEKETVRDTNRLHAWAALYGTDPTNPTRHTPLVPLESLRLNKDLATAYLAGVVDGWDAIGRGSGPNEPLDEALVRYRAAKDALNAGLVR